MVLRDWKNTENAKKMTQTSQGLSKNILPNRQKLPNCVKIANSKKTRVPIFSCLNLRIMQENETGELVRHQSNTYKYPASAHTSSSRTCNLASVVYGIFFWFSCFYSFLFGFWFLFIFVWFFVFISFCLVFFFNMSIMNKKSKFKAYRSV